MMQMHCLGPLHGRCGQWVGCLVIWLFGAAGQKKNNKISKKNKKQKNKKQTLGPNDAFVSFGPFTWWIWAVCGVADWWSWSWWELRWVREGSDIDVHLLALTTYFWFLATFTKNIQCRHLINEWQPKQEHSVLWWILIRSLAILTPIFFISFGNRHTV